MSIAAPPGCRWEISWAHDTKAIIHKRRKWWRRQKESHSLCAANHLSRGFLGDHCWMLAKQLPEKSSNLGPGSNQVATRPGNVVKQIQSNIAFIQSRKGEKIGYRLGTKRHQSLPAKQAGHPSDRGIVALLHFIQGLVACNTSVLSTCSQHTKCCVW